MPESASKLNNEKSPLLQHTASGVMIFIECIIGGINGIECCCRLLLLVGIVETRRQCACKPSSRKRREADHLTHFDTDKWLAARQASISHGEMDHSSTGGSLELPPGPKDEKEFRVLLGRSTWRLLHTIAARYPDVPSKKRKEQTAKFIELLGYLYPCTKCAGHLRKMLASDPPQMDSQNDFSQWLCNIHNKVNARLNKPMFPCENVDSHYDCGCGIGAPTEEEDGGPTDKPIRPPESPAQKEFPIRAKLEEQQ